MFLLSFVILPALICDMSVISNIVWDTTEEVIQQN